MAQQSSTKSRRSGLSREESLSPPPQHWPVNAIAIAIIFLAVITVEYSTPSAFVFGYLYAGAITFAHRRLSRRQVLAIAISAAALTLLNLVVPNNALQSPPTVANRLIAVAALLLTGYLSDRNRRYEDEIARQKAHIHAQTQLADLREDFVSTLTHDLKTPLLGAIETARSFSAGDFGQVSDRQREVLGMMRRSHQSTLKLVETMLRVYCNDAEGLGLDLAAVNLRSLLQETVAELTELAKRRNIRLHLLPRSQPDKSAEWVYGDVLQLRRVFENLLSNAINHAPRDTPVKIVLTMANPARLAAFHGSSPIASKKQQWQIQVCDRGPGITPDELPQLFDRFYQSYSNRQSKGSGLGLYLSRQIVEAHGGKIWAESRDPQGAVFTCRLPAVPAPDHERREPAKDSTSRG